VFGRFNDDAFTLPMLAMIMCVILADLGLPYVLGPSLGRRRLHTIWFAALAVLGLLAIVAYFAAFEPVLTFGRHMR
jgi:hypothetical protein